ncbi:MAG: M48 family metallopeptidase [bacterium]
MSIEYTLVRSARKTIGIEVGPEGVTVRAPRSATKKAIEEAVARHRGWIEEKLTLYAGAKELPPLTRAELEALAQEAMRVIPERVRHFAPLVGVQPGAITIRNQRTRWGSCSTQGNLNFNCLLMLTPPEVVDSVVVHELCHMLEPNHSPRFYAHVLRVCPAYREREAWLKKHGPAIMARNR